MSPSNRQGAPNTTRGLVIVVAAAVLGLVLLARGGSNSLLGATQNPTRSKTTTTVVNVPTIPKPAVTTAPTATNPPADVKVGIYNGTGGKDGSAAGNNQKKLAPLGYTQVSINDSGATPKSVIYYAEGAQGDATAISKALGLPGVTVESVASAASLPPGAQGLAVVVIIGENSVTGN